MARLSQKATSTKRLEAAMPPRFSCVFASDAKQSNALFFANSKKQTKL